jgi:hypothetical protein
MTATGQSRLWLPHLERSESDGRPVGMSTGVDEPFYIADATHANLDRIVDGKRDLSRRKPSLAIAAAQSPHRVPNPLQSQQGVAAIREIV